MPHFEVVRCLRYTADLDAGVHYLRIEADNIEQVRAMVLAEEEKNDFRNTLYGHSREIKVFRVEEELTIDIGKIADEWEEAEEAVRNERKERARRLLKDAGLEGVLE